MEQLKMQVILDIRTWLLRLKHRKGFGVQSPFAYNLICNVINEKGWYYSYDSLIQERMKKKKSELRNNLKSDKLLFRLSNYIQPTVIIIPSKDFSMSKRYLVSGCKAADSVMYSDSHQLSDLVRWGNQTELLYVRGNECDEKSLFEIITRMHEKSLLVVENIYGSKQAKLFWHRLADSTATVLTFDLYDFGLVFFDRKYIKQHYIVSF